MLSSLIEPNFLRGIMTGIFERLIAFGDNDIPAFGVITFGEHSLSDL